MARPLRIERPGAWYHVTGPGLERRRIFLDERDRRHWLELLEEAVPRWRLRVHAYVLMDNHHHLMLETREANLGDWGRDLMLYLGRRSGAMRLVELGQAAGGMDYAAVSAAVQRLSRRLKADQKLDGITRRAARLLNLETRPHLTTPTDQRRQPEIPQCEQGDRIR